jgi:APA family basic amino acid/polyamine antiporter
MSGNKYTFSVAVTLVVANMVGTGVFTSLGYQVGPVPSAFAILMLWLMGGVVAFCGALCYAEIGTTLQKSGSEYVYLSNLYHPALGFLSGWTSLMVGFAGAVSAVSLAIGEYAHELFGLPVKQIAVGSILLVTIIHLFGVRTGGIAQNILTGFKVSLIFFFCVVPFFMEAGVSLSGFIPVENDLDIILSPGWAISLVFVVYAYSGWNASTYIAGNLENPAKNLPRSLMLGTVIVTLIYLMLNGMFLSVASFQELDGQNDIGNVAALKIFGPHIGKIFSGIFSVALLSTLSAMTIAGPRVGEAMGQDYPALGILSAKNRFEMPYLAILMQSAWAITLVFLGSFSEIIQYISVSLSWFTVFTVIGIFILRYRMRGQPRLFKVPAFPVPPIIFIVATLWMVTYVTINNPAIIIYSVGTVFVGLLLFFLASRKQGA